MNEVVPLGTRARESIVAASRRLGRRVSSWWGSFTGLGMGAVFLSLGVLVAAGIGVAVFEGRGGKDPVPCEQARDDVTTIQHMSHTGRLTAAQVAQLHHDASQLAAIAPTAHGDDAKAITDAATLADRAAVGRKLHTSRLAIEFEAACPQGGSTSGGGLKTY